MLEWRRGADSFKDENGAAVMETALNGTKKQIFFASKEPEPNNLKRIRWGYDSNMDWTTLPRPKKNLQDDADLKGKLG